MIHAGLELEGKALAIAEGKRKRSQRYDNTFLLLVDIINRLSHRCFSCR
ncbi:hypothetical protein [Armatimonas sp.]